MGVCVYRDGDSHVEFGIKCEKAIIDSRKIGAFLSSGWRLTPDKVENPEPVNVDVLPDDAGLHPAVAARRKGRPPKAK